MASSHIHSTNIFFLLSVRMSNCNSQHMYSKEIKSHTLIQQCSVVPEHNRVLVERYLRIELDMASQPFNIFLSATELENDGIDYYLCPNCTTSLSRAGI